nr:Protein of unknown function DUF595 domain containing protein [Haemonchus contortus]
MNSNFEEVQGLCDSSTYKHRGPGGRLHVESNGAHITLFSLVICKVVRAMLIATTCVFLIWMCWRNSSSAVQSFSPNGSEPTPLSQTIKKKNRPPGVLPPYFHYDSQFLVAPKYHLATCQISKNMATIRFSIFCFLNDIEKFLGANRTISEDFWDYRFCNDHFRRKDSKSALDVAGANATIFAVIRHPIERFLSGYVDRCVNRQYCLGCSSDLRCFVDMLYRTLVKYYENPSEVVQDTTTEHVLRHFAPQTWFCDFKNHKNEYVLLKQHVGPNGTHRIADEFYEVFEKAGVLSEHRAIIHKEMLKGTTVHSTSQSLARKEARERLLRTSISWDV